jgi:alpha-pyrone synthase
MEVAITAIGTANPSYKQHQQKIAELMSATLNLTPVKKRILKSIYKATGIEYRHSVLSDYCKTHGQFEFFPNNHEDAFPSTADRMKIYKDNALQLSITAIENCLATFGAFDKTQITHLITVSCTGMYAPGIDIELVQHLKLRSSTKRTSINFMGCYGAFNAIKVATSICSAEPEAKVLVVCIELCSIHFQKNTSLDHIFSNAIFADGAGAILIEAKNSHKKCLSLAAFYCDLLPQTHQEMAWHIADSGFDIILSSYIPEIIQTGIASFTQRLLTEHALTLSNIDFYAIHPGGIKILQACEASLSIKEEHNKYAYQVLRNYGNMSSATILFVLKAIWDDITQKDHDKIIFSCAFGPGLTLESMLLKTHSIEM